MLQKLLKSKLFTFVLVFFGYLLVHFTNNYFTEFLHLLPGAHLIHIPSGFKLLIVLIAGWVGALGIFTAALIASVAYKFPSEYLIGLQLAVMNGIAPLAAKQYCKAAFNLKEDLSVITAQQLLMLGLAFSFLNSTLNQAVLFWNGATENFLDGIVVMFIGDLTGAYVVFLLLKFISEKLIKEDRTEI